MIKQTSIHCSKLICAALILLIFVIYAQVVTFQFTNFDDHFFVTENQYVLNGLTLKNVLWAFTDFSQGSWQPLTWLSHMTDCQMFGLNPSWHHLVSVVVHAVNSALLFYVLNLYTGAIWRSSLVAVLFAIHPLHVESVAWISERRDVLSGMWWMLTMWRYWIWCHHRQRRNAVLVGLCFLGGLMSKPIIVTLPLIFLLLDIWPLQRVSATSLGQLLQQKKKVLSLIGEKIPLFIMALISGVLTIFAEGGQGTLGTLTSYPMTLRVGNALLSYVRYLGKTLWPTSLLPFYTYPDVLPWQVWLAVAALTLITLYCLWQFPKHPYLLIGWLWYLVMLLPVIGIIQQGEFAMADRYTYLPLIGVFVMLIWGGGALVTALPWWRREWSIAIAVCLVVALSAVTFRQTSFWRDTPTLFAHTLKEDPGNFKAMLQLGAYYRDGGELELARDYFLQALKQDSNNHEALSNLGDVYGQMGRFEEAERYFQQTLALNAADIQVHVHLGIVRAKQGKIEEAVLTFERALMLQPDNVKIRLNLGGALYLLGQFEQASEQFAIVLRAEPGSADAYNGLGLVLMGQERYADAVHQFQEAVRLDPSFQSAQDNLLSASLKVGEGR